MLLLKKNKLLIFIKLILTKIGLKPILLLIIYSRLWQKYIHPIIFFFIKLPLRLKYYQSFRINKLVPTNHLIAIDIVQELSKVYASYGVKFFLSGGLLLGAVRQESFAGRPSDVDLGLIDTHFDIFYKNIDLIKKNFNTIPLQTHIKRKFDKKKFKIYNPDFALIQKNVKPWTQMEGDLDYKFEIGSFDFLLDKYMVGIQFFALKEINGKKYWIGNAPELSNVFFSYNDLLELDTIKAYNLKFYSPKNPEKYLDAVYGKNWKTPINKQFIWKK